MYEEVSISSYNHKGFPKEAFVAFGIKENLKNLAKLLKFLKLPILSIVPFFLHAYGAFSL